MIFKVDNRCAVATADLRSIPVPSAGNPHRVQTPSGRDDETQDGEDALTSAYNHARTCTVA